MWSECVGAFHVHTRYSDGTAGVRAVLDAARLSGVDFVVVADHDTLAASREGWAGHHDGVDLLVAAEITPRKRGHVLAVGVAHCSGYALAPSDRTLDEVAAQGGVVLVAHPQGKDRPWLRIRHSPWYHWDHPAIRGLEIWSYMHDWLDAVAWWRFPLTHTVCNYPQRVVRGPERAVLRLWDTLGRVRRYAGFAGLDCHGRRIPLADIRIFPYERMFRLVRNHFFIPRATPPHERPRALWRALLEGRGFVAHDALADARGTQCLARVPDGATLCMGAEHRFVPGIEMRLRLPRPAEITWIANGVARLTTRGDAACAMPLEPGVYRFEARLDGRPWIFTNPFYLRPPP